MGKKISELTAISALSAADLIAVVDDADTTTKKATVTQLRMLTVDAKVASYTLVADDAGKILTVNAAGAVNVTVPALPVGSHVIVIQLGAGQVTFAPSGTTLRNRQSHTKIAGQYGAASIAFHVAGEFTLFGDTAA
jgi:hypothetical protein